MTTPHAHDVAHVRVSPATGLSLELAQSMLECCADGFVVAQIDQGDVNLIYANPAFLTMVGRTSVQERNGEALALLGLGDVISETATLREALSQERVVSGIVNLLREDGVVVRTRVHLQPLANQAANASGPHHVLAMYRTLSDDGWRERELAERYFRLKRMIDSFPALVSYWAVDERCKFANAAHQEWFGIAPEQCQGMSIEDVMGERLYKLNEPHIRAAIAGRPQHFERVLRDVHGNTRNTQTYYVPDLTGNEVRGFYMLATETTQLKKIEGEQRQVQALEAIGRLAGGLAHEMNTPLQFVGDSIRVLVEGSADLEAVVAAFRSLVERARSGNWSAGADEEVLQLEDRLELPELLGSMQQAAESATTGLDRLARLVRAMRDFARPQESDRIAFNLNSAIESTLVVARQQYAAVADVETSLGKLPLVHCHGAAINLVFLHLLVNAAQAIANARLTARGKIFVRTFAIDHDAVMEVSDNGCGIAPDIRDKIFEPFFSSGGDGFRTGQGLAMSYAVVVERHGGSITVESEVDVGTTVRVRLPVQTPEHLLPIPVGPYDPSRI